MYTVDGGPVFRSAFVLNNLLNQLGLRAVCFWFVKKKIIPLQVSEINVFQPVWAKQLKHETIFRIHQSTDACDDASYKIRLFLFRENT